jgi:hypothetical protein
VCGSGVDQGEALAVADPLGSNKKRQLNKLFALNRRVMKAYLLKESLDRLWAYTYEGAMLRIYKAGSTSCAGSGSSPWRNWHGCC